MTGQSHHLDYRIRRELIACLDDEKALDALAASLGRTDARVLWHLQQLAVDGLVESWQDETRWRRTLAGEALLAGRAADPPAQAFPDRVAADFEDALRELEDGLYGEEAVQASGEHRTRLSTAQAAEFRDRLLGLIAEYFAPGQGDRDGIKYGFHWIMTPIDLHPLEEAEHRETARRLIESGGTQPDLKIPPRRRPVDPAE